MITFGYKSKVSGILRALSAIGIGLVMIFGTNATDTLVKIIATFLFAAGVVSFVYGIVNKKSGALSLMSVNALVDIVIGLLLYFNPAFIAGFIVYIIGIVLIILGAVQLIALSGALSMIGMGYFSVFFSVLAILGGVFLLFNPFSMKIMSIIAGIWLVIYGIQELVSSWRINKASKIFEAQFTKQDPEQQSPINKIDSIDISDAKEVDCEKVE